MRGNVTLIKAGGMIHSYLIVIINNSTVANENYSQLGSLAPRLQLRVIRI